MRKLSQKDAIHNFAVKYFDLYRNPQTINTLVSKDFETICSSLGFQIDGGQALINAYYPETFDHCHYLKQIIDRIDDIQLLGNAIFSYYARCRLQNFSTLSAEPRSWMETAFERLAVITSCQLRSPYLFEGTLQTVKLVSNRTGMELNISADEVEQRLTIQQDGQVQLERYAGDNKSLQLQLLSSQNFQLTSTKVIFEALSYYFGHISILPIVAFDEGSWQIQLINTTGRVLQYQGSLCQKLKVHNQDLSELIRQQLKISDLYVFDGNFERIDQLKITYQGITATDYLELNRQRGTLIYQQTLLNGQKMLQTYYLITTINDLLDIWDLDLQEAASTSPQKWQVSWRTRQGNTAKFYLDFTQPDLLIMWQEFVQKLQKILDNYQQGELLKSPLLLSDSQQRVICQVTFKKQGKFYNYLGKDGLQVGDWVIVPVGSDNHQLKARIQKISNEIPFLGLDHLKSIIRQCTPNDFE
ncbi:hypothetical protein DS830_05230 [Bombilactobacillus bombi]|uniref:hypothetical protein n=1 Tax=Bombilactobacillus bombi TaxID=1303590 RepID=UPI000E5742D7|nr:hypothetical protein [Bombilactobacillus bombi]AXX64912.1 hypothetical protein DS830_05230 [Bombilactobacillus bombi]